MFMPSLDDIRRVMARKGYAFFERGDYNVNIIGIRNSLTVTNKFDDTLILAYKVSGEWHVDYIPCTTDPGKGPMENPGVKGRAVLKPGQYRGAFSLGLHKGRQKALVQTGPVTVYRDKNGDRTLDYDNPDTGLFGINIHWSSTTHDSVQVDNWSEGCQVGTGAEDYNVFINLLTESASRYGKTFTYTLLEACDFEEY